MNRESKLDDIAGHLSDLDLDRYENLGVPLLLIKDMVDLRKDNREFAMKKVFLSTLNRALWEWKGEGWVSIWGRSTLRVDHLS